MLEYSEVVCHEETCEFSDQVVGKSEPSDSEEDKDDQPKTCRECGGELDPDPVSPHRCAKELRRLILDQQKESSQLRQLMSTMLQTLTTHDQLLFPSRHVPVSLQEPEAPAETPGPQLTVTASACTATSDGSQSRCQGCGKDYPQQPDKCEDCAWGLTDYDKQYIDVQPDGHIFHIGFHDEEHGKVVDAIRSDKSFSKGVHKFVVEVAAGTIYDGFGVVAREEYQRTGINNKMIGFYSNYTSNMQTVDTYYAIKDHSPYEVTLDFNNLKLRVKGGSIDVQGELEAKKEYYIVFAFFGETEMTVNQSFPFDSA